MDEIQRADPRAKWLALSLLAIGLIVGGGALAFIRLRWPDVERWLVSDLDRLPLRIALLNAAIILATAAPAMWFGGYLWRRGGSIRREERFPLEHDRVLRDTPVMRGDPAVSRGRRLQWIAVVLGAAGLGLALAFWRLGSMIARLAA